MDTLMDEPQLRDWAARALKWSTVPDPIWEDTVEGGYVRDALADSKGREELLEFLRERMRFYRRMKTWERSPIDTDQSEDAGEEDESFYAQLGVKETRRAELGGPKLSKNTSPKS